MSASTFQLEPAAHRADIMRETLSVSNLAETVQKSCLLIALVAVPLTTAWAMEAGLVVLFIASGLLAVAGGLRGDRQTKRPYGSLLPVYIATAACLLVMLQLVPLPASMLRILSPLQERLFADWSQLHLALATPEAWRTISLTPHLTESCLALSATYLMFVIGLRFFLQSQEDVTWLLWVIAVSSVVMATVGLSQLLFGNGKFLWVFENPMRSAAWPAKGTFTNQNHFAGFLALGIGPCLLLVFGTGKRVSSERESSTKFATRQRGSHSRQSVHKGWAAASIVVLLATILSFSRGGVAALSVALLVSCFAFRNRLAVLSKFMLPAVAICVLGLLAFGAEAFSSRWNLLVTSTSLEEVSAPRIALWQSLVEAAPSFAMAGAGAGSHAEVYPIWMEEDFGKRFSHAENGYLQLLIEMGIPGMLLLAFTLFALLKITRQAFRNGITSSRAVLWICSAGVMTSLVHSLADFVWYIPAYLIVALSLLISLFRSAELQHARAKVVDSQPTSGFSHLKPVMIGVLVSSICYLGLPRVIADAKSESHWLKYRGMAIDVAESKSNEQILEEQVGDMIASLEACIERDPGDYRAMSELAVMYLRRFEISQAQGNNPMTLAEIRGTVQSVEFESRREMLRWMVTAFGDEVGDLFRALIISRTSISGQPLRATPYLVLHQLSFLITDQEGAEDILMDQVLRVRPHDAAIRYAAGIADVEAGRLSKGYERLAFAFAKDVELRKVIFNQLVDIMTPRELIDILKPDVEALAQIFAVYRDRDDTEDLPWIARKFRTDFSNAKHPQRAQYWFEAASVFEYLDDQDAEIAALKKAVVLNPQSYAGRRILAVRTAAVGNPDEAIASLKACLIRNPDDKAIKRRLIELQRISRHISAGRTN